MAHGSRGQKIFADDTDRKRFLETLPEACQRTGWHVHAYDLMGNHYHLLVETPEFQVVSTYIHLNSARAGLIRIGEQRLKRYRWSS